MPERKQVIRYVFYALGLLAVNYLVTFAARIALLLFLFRGDAILAAVPAALALPAILLQPWFLVFFIIPEERIIAPLLTTVLTIVVYAWLNADGRLEGAKQLLLRFRKRRIIAVAGGLILIAIGVSAARYVDFPPARHGMPPSLGMADLTLTESRSYCLGQFIDSQWLWRAHLSESELDRFAQRYRLQLINGSDLPDEFKSMPPYWWQISITERTRVLSTPNFPLRERGPDGLHAIASWNPDDQVLHVWIKDNF